MTLFKTLDDAALQGKRVLVRVDLNVPMKDGVVTDTTRIERILPTIREITEKGGRAILLAHFGRPKGKVDPSQSLAPSRRFSPRSSASPSASPRIASARSPTASSPT